MIIKGKETKVETKKGAETENQTMIWKRVNQDRGVNHAKKKRNKEQNLTMTMKRKKASERMNQIMTMKREGKDKKVNLIMTMNRENQNKGEKQIMIMKREMAVQKVSLVPTTREHKGKPATAGLVFLHQF